MTATDKNDPMTKNLKHKPNYIQTNMYNYIQYSKLKIIQKYKMFTLISNYKHQSMVIKTVINNDRTKTVDITSCLHSIATPSLIV